MDTREDKLLALVVLLSTGLIAVLIIFSMMWFSDLSSGVQPLSTVPESCINPRAETL